jgi:Fe-Mn family superoxide dismutase
MEHFTAKTFTVPTLIGISAKNIEEHLKLYAGYVKHTNLILEKITEYTKDAETNAYVLGELQRRFSFEFDGMRNHEYYFASLENGPQAINTESALYKKITEQFGSYDAWLMRFKAIALTRGIGWAILYYDAQTDKLLNTWVEEQHLGHLTGLTPILALDVWEHAYVVDYHPSGKKQYVEDFFNNLNWSVIEKNFEK